MPYKDKSKQRACQLKWTLERRRYYVDNHGGACVQCGSKERLEFDHIDPETKTSHRIWTWKISRIEAELEKCQLLCRACHEAKTAAENAARFLKDVQHGTLYAYQKRGCRCVECKAIYKVFRSKWYYAAKERDYARQQLIAA